MSSLIVKIVKINKIEKHPNADRLQIAYMEDNDWSVVIGLNQFKVGNLAIYVPVDSLLDEKLENYLFPLDSKIKLNNHRVRAIKIRSYISVGMFVELTQELISLYPELSKKKSGEDVASLLNIQKYEPPIRNLPKNMQGRIAKRNHSLFKKYTDIENIKFFTNVILIDEMVQISEKCHGSNSRYAVLPTETISFWNKIKKFLRLLPKKEFLIGSHNIQLNINKKLYYDRNIYKDYKKILKTLKFNNYISQELAFDVDADNIICDHPKNKSVCKKCLNKIYKAALKMKGEINDLGFKKIEIVYSGRGFHVHVMDKKASLLSVKERSSLNKKFKKFPIDPWVSRGYIRLIRMPYSLNSLVSRKTMPIKTKKFSSKTGVPKFLKN